MSNGDYGFIIARDAEAKARTAQCQADKAQEQAERAQWQADRNALEAAGTERRVEALSRIVRGLVEKVSGHDGMISAMVHEFEDISKRFKRLESGDNTQLASIKRETQKDFLSFPERMLPSDSPMLEFYRTHRAAIEKLFGEEMDVLSEKFDTDNRANVVQEQLVLEMRIDRPPVSHCPRWIEDAIDDVLILFDVYARGREGFNGRSMEEEPKYKKNQDGFGSLEKKFPTDNTCYWEARETSFDSYGSKVPVAPSNRWGFRRFSALLGYLESMDVALTKRDMRAFLQHPSMEPYLRAFEIEREEQPWGVLSYMLEHLVRIYQGYDYGSFLIMGPAPTKELLPLPQMPRTLCGKNNELVMTNRAYGMAYHPLAALHPGLPTSGLMDFFQNGPRPIMDMFSAQSQNLDTPDKIISLLEATSAPLMGSRRCWPLMDIPWCLPEWGKMLSSDMYCKEALRIAGHDPDIMPDSRKWLRNIPEVTRKLCLRYINFQYAFSGILSPINPRSREWLTMPFADEYNETAAIEKTQNHLQTFPDKELPSARDEAETVWVPRFVEDLRYKGSLATPHQILWRKGILRSGASRWEIATEGVSKMPSIQQLLHLVVSTEKEHAAFLYWDDGTLVTRETALARPNGVSTLAANSVADVEHIVFDDIEKEVNITGDSRVKQALHIKFDAALRISQKKAISLGM